MNITDKPDPRDIPEFDEVMRKLVNVHPAELDNEPEDEGKPGMTQPEE